MLKDWLGSTKSVDTPSKYCFKVEGKPIGIFRFKLKNCPQKCLINIEPKIQTLVNIFLAKILLICFRVAFRVSRSLREMFQI